jgi:hypothetical protein
VCSTGPQGAKWRLAQSVFASGAIKHTSRDEVPGNCHVAITADPMNLRVQYECMPEAAWTHALLTGNHMCTHACTYCNTRH